MASQVALQMDDHTLSRLANELAREIYSPEDVMRTFNLSLDEFGAIVATNQTFQQMYREAHALWHSTTNVSGRIEVKSRFILEQYLDQAYKDLHNENVSLSAKVELAKMLAGFGKLLTKDPLPAAQVGDKFTIQINFSNKQISTEKALQPPPVEAEYVVLPS